MKPSTIYHGEGELSGANINRSPTSYDANPADERAMYEHNTDHIFVQLNIFDAVTEKPRFGRFVHYYPLLYTKNLFLLWQYKSKFVV